MSGRALVGGLLAVVIVLVGASCQSDKKDVKTSSPREAVKFQLFWSPDVEFAPFYAAVQQNYYQHEGLAVELLDGGFDTNDNYIEVLPVVSSGEADFGLAGGDQILLARAQGEPLVAIATLQQNSSTGFLSLVDKHITKPDDLRGKRVWIWGEDITFDIFFQHVGLQLSDMIDVGDIDVYGESGYDALLNGTVDAMSAYIYNEPNVLRAMGYETNFVLLQDYGVDIYPDVIFTTEQVIQEKPEAVQAFINGTLRGMQYALDNPTEMSDYILAQYRDELDSALTPEMVRTMLIAQALLIAPVNSPFAKQPGMMSLDIWQSTYDDMLALGLLDQPLDLNQVYNLSFVETYYKNQKR